MQDKKQLNLKAIDELVKTSSFRQLLGFGVKGMQGVGGGLATGGIIITLLALAGITAAFIFEIITAVAGATVFAVISVITAGYQLIRDQRHINVLKADFDNKVELLRDSIIALLTNYALVTEIIDSLKEDITHLTELSKENQKFYPKEADRISTELKALNTQLTNLKKSKREIFYRLTTSLDSVAGRNYESKLTELFQNWSSGQPGTAGVKEYSKAFAADKGFNLDQINVGVEKFWLKLNTPPALSVEKQKMKSTISDEFDTFKKEHLKPRQKIHSGIKKVVYSLTAVGGFIGGVGATITLGALALGGIAALMAFGWPVLVASLAVGAISMVGSLLYYRHVEKKQQKIINRLNVANEQISSIKNYINEKINNKVGLEVDYAKKRYDEAGNKTKNFLEGIKNNFDDVNKQTQQNHIDVEAAKKLHTSNAGNAINESEITLIIHKINKNITLLKNKRHDAMQVAPIACSEDLKIKLLTEIDQSLKLAKEDLQACQEQLEIKNRQTPVEIQTYLTTPDEDDSEGEAKRP